MNMAYMLVQLSAPIGEGAGTMGRRGFAEMDGIFRIVW